MAWDFCFGFGVTINKPYPLKLILKTGVFCFPANIAKSEDDTILNYFTDEQYLERYRNSSVWGLIKLDWLIVLDGLRAILKGYDWKLPPE
ncbi:uncharacterized protein METZ01_LOCUS411085 [marine metagenome]|uniref:Uncharacterized protein n=1 Tax=marine metagenome TaxID=408172 RepID=A0A382WJI2_9ZZZZ